jgi:hypothetical protein
MSKLRGKAIANLPEEKKEKMQKTLDKMVERRVEDSRNLRKVIEDKLVWAKAEKKKGLEVLDKQYAQIKDNKETLLKLDGIILVLIQLLEPEKPEEKKE